MCPKVADLHRAGHDLGAGGPGPLDGLGGVVDVEVDRPRVRTAHGPVVAHQPRDRLAVAEEHPVAAERLVGLGGGPAEQSAVELDGRVGVGGEQLDPAGCAGHGHDVLLGRGGRVAHVDRPTTRKSSPDPVVPDEHPVRG
jgi:hypothetical protein